MHLLRLFLPAWPAFEVNTQIDQLGVDINSRFKSNVDHLNVLQKHLKTVNDNIISLANWLGNQPMFLGDTTARDDG